MLPLTRYFLSAAFSVAVSGFVRATPVRFDLPSQPAAAALLAFAQQAKVEILFSSAGLKNISAPELRGVYEPEHAIARLLKGTGFTVTREAMGKYVVMAAVEKAGPDKNAEAPSVRALSPATSERGEVYVAGRVVELPPLTVSAATVERPWNYLKIPGYEILSRCKPSAVMRWAQEIERVHQWLGVMLPDEFRINRDVPTSVLLYDVQNKPEVSPEVVSDMLRKNGATDGKTIAYRSLPNMRLADKDAMGFFFILDPSVFGTLDTDSLGVSPIAIGCRPGGAKLKLAEEYVHYLAKNRTPALPDWFVDGVVDLFKTADFSGDAVVMGPMTWLTPAKTAEIRKSTIAAVYGIHLDPDESSPPIAESQADDAQLPPLAELFAATRNPDRDEVLRSEAVLFIRWGLDRKNQPRRDSLWTFIKRASTEPVTEEMFQECFGYGYADARLKIGDYLFNAVTKSLRLVPAETTELPPLTLQLATRLEIARIKGDWDRLEINYVKSHFPELTARYVEQARRTLHRAYDKGERDPRLLAIMGLCECDAGDDAAAGPLLEAAVQGGVVRPRVYYELARLRYLEARKKSELPGGKLTTAQAAAILQPLASARRQQPPLLEAYTLAAEVWARTDLALTRRELEVLDEGVQFFPWDARFIYQTAWLNVQHGFKSEAEALVSRGLKVNASDTLRLRLEKLRAELAAAAAPSQAVARP